MEEKIEEILEVLNTFIFYNRTELDEREVYEIQKQIDFWEDFKERLNYY